MKSFKLINKTGYHGWDLRKIIRKGLIEYYVDLSHYQVCVKYDGASGHPHCGSYAILGEPKIVMSVDPDGVDVGVFARELAHEIEHTLGLEHKDMLDIDTIETTWAKGLQIRTCDEYRNGTDR